MVSAPLKMESAAPPTAAARNPPELTIHDHLLVVRQRWADGFRDVGLCDLVVTALLLGATCLCPLENLYHHGGS